MIIATLWITCQTTSGHDAFGQPVLGPTWKEKVAPVKILFGSQHTTVRTDSSASHGNAYEVVADVVFLAKANSNISMNDTLTIHGNKVSVTGLHPRYQVTGALDHVEIHCSGAK